MSTRKLPVASRLLGSLFQGTRDGVLLRLDEAGAQTYESQGDSAAPKGGGRRGRRPGQLPLRGDHQFVRSEPALVLVIFFVDGDHPKSSASAVAIGTCRRLPVPTDRENAPRRHPVRLWIREADDVGTGGRVACRSARQLAVEELERLNVDDRAVFGKLPDADVSMRAVAMLVPVQRACGALVVDIGSTPQRLEPGPQAA